MGVERVFQAALGLIAVGLLASTVDAAPSIMRKPRERVAVIDLGPADDGTIRRRISGVVAAAGFELVVGDGVEDALAGVATEADGVQLAQAIAEAQKAFGALDCKATQTAARQAIGLAAARQAAGLAVPELARAWTLVLLCADRTSDSDAAMRAATHLRTVGGSTDVPADVWAKYPAVDTMLDRDAFPLEITTDTPGATIYIDFEAKGVSPLRTFVTAGEHTIGAAAGGKRGWAQGSAVKTQTTLAIPMTDFAAPTSALAARVAGWAGAVPPPAELEAVLGRVNARVALIRRGQTIEVWGHIGSSEPPHKLGGEDGTGSLDDIGRLVELIKDRVHVWNDRAPDPDQPLLVEDPKIRKPTAKAEEPTRWWVYAALLGAAAIGGTVLFLHDTADNTQRVELHYP